MTKLQSHIRPSKNFTKLINYVKARSLLEGKKMPSTSKITEKISQMMDKEALWREFL